MFFVLLHSNFGCIRFSIHFAIFISILTFTLSVYIQTRHNDIIKEHHSQSQFLIISTRSGKQHRSNLHHRTASRSAVMREPRDAAKTDPKTAKSASSAASFPLILDIDDFKVRSILQFRFVKFRK